MRNQYYSNSRPQNEFSPLRENYNLKVDDIPGAVPKFGYTTKKINHYATKLINDQRPFEAKLATKEQAYQSGLYHEDFSPTSSQKKHYNAQYGSEIAHTGLMAASKKPMNAFSAGLPRTLEVDTRPYMPPTTQSQSVKNYEYANKVVDAYPSPQRYNAHQDSLDQFQQKQNHRGHSDDSRHYMPPQEAPLESQRGQYENQRDYYEKNYSQRQVPQEEFYPRQTQGYNGSRQEIGGPNSSRHVELDRLSKEIVLQQQALEQKMRETMRRRAFNIISNQSSPNYDNDYSRRYGSSIKGMVKNTEYNRTGRGWADFQSTMRTQDAYQTQTQHQDVNRKQYSEPFVAGMNNDYAETNYRYANQLPKQQPLPKEQYYGAGALKNMSSVKLY